MITKEEKIENIRYYLNTRNDVAKADSQYNEAMKDYALGCKKAIEEIYPLTEDFTKLKSMVLEVCTTFNRDKITTFRVGYIHIYDKVKREIERKY